jgi:membrane protease subunit HflK
MLHFSPPKGVKKINAGTISVLIVIIFALFLVITSFYVVDQAEEAVITRFGKYKETIGPGLHFKMPLGIDKAYLVNVKNVQTQQFGFRTISSGISSKYTEDMSISTMLTGDLNMVNVEWIIQYRIVDSFAWTFNVNEKNQTIRDVSQ